jgi:hypothetical protein
MSPTLIPAETHSVAGRALTSFRRHGAHVSGGRGGANARGILPPVVLAAVVVALVAVLGWNAAGGRLFVMATPSMCPTVCVGSLVADRQLQGAVHVGELITFHPPSTPAETYTHEVSHIFANGTIQTRGVANPEADPWLITRSDIVGRVVFSVWELGWLLKALPLLAVGVLFWMTARPWIGERTRRSWDRGWMTILAVLPLWLLHPLVSATVVSATLGVPHHPHWATYTVVNTGILPVLFHVAKGRAVHVSTTGLGRVAGALSANGSLALHDTVSLPWWGWAVLALVVVSPLVGYVWHAWRDDEVVLTTGVPSRAAPAAHLP